MTLQDTISQLEVLREALDLEGKLHMAGVVDNAVIHLTALQEIVSGSESDNDTSDQAAYQELGRNQQ